MNIYLLVKVRSRNNGIIVFFNYILIRWYIYQNLFLFIQGNALEIVTPLYLPGRSKIDWLCKPHEKTRVTGYMINCRWQNCDTPNLIGQADITVYWDFRVISVHSQLVIPISSREGTVWSCHIMVMFLTHWGRVTHICVSKQTSIGSDNGLSPGRRQAIIWANAGILLIGPLGTNLC